MKIRNLFLALILSLVAPIIILIVFNLAFSLAFNASNLSVAAQSETLPPKTKKQDKKTEVEIPQTGQLKDLLPDKSAAPMLIGKFFVKPELNLVNIKDTAELMKLSAEHSVSYKNKITVLLFWEHTCGFCLLALPEIEKLNAKFKNQNINFYAVNPKDWNKKNKLVTFLNSYKYQLIDFNDTTGEVSLIIDTNTDANTNTNRTLNVPMLFIDEKTQNDFWVTNFPTTYVIDKDGLIYTAMVGYFKEYGDWLSFLLSNMLASDK